MPALCSISRQVWPSLLAAGDASSQETGPATALGNGNLLIILGGAVVVLAAVALVYAVARRRMADSGENLLLIDAGALRGFYLVCLVVYLILAIYGSLIPLEYRSVDWGTAMQRFRGIRFLEMDEVSRADWVANILLFVPLAYLATAVLTLGIRSWPARIAAVIVVAAGCATLSVAIEFTQIWFWPRTVSLNDILAESIGGVIGALLWLALGTTVHAWLASYLSPQRRRTQVDQLLEFYLIGLVIYSLLPLDLTISPAELYHKFSQGKVALLPFSDFQWNMKLAYSVATDVAIFIPVGMYCATAFTSVRQPVRGLLASTLLGTGAAATIEVAQLFVLQHHTSATTVVLAAVGSAIGAALMRRLRVAETDVFRRGWSEVTSRRAALICLSLIGIYSLVLLAVFCSDGEWLTDPERLWKRFHGFWRPPLAALYWSPEYNALSDVLRKILFFMPLGALGAGAIVGLRPSQRDRWLLMAAVLLFAAGVGMSIEMLQVYLPPSMADVGDVLVCTAGTALGLFMAWRILAAGATAGERGA